MKKYTRIALIGLDGSGKSANINKMKSDTDYANYEFAWVRWEPKLLFPAYWLLNLRLKRKENAVPENVDGKTSIEQAKMNAEYQKKSGLKEKVFRNAFVRAMWMRLAIIDYFFQFHYKMAKTILTKKNVIFDRFFLDLFVDQGINFGYTPQQIDKKIKHYR